MYKGISFLLIGLIAVFVCTRLVDTSRLKEKWIAFDGTPSRDRDSDFGRKSITEMGAVNVTQVLPQCILGASRSYRVPAEVMIGIMSIEGGHSGQEVGPNLNGTYDLGIMQVNSLWIPRLARLWRVDYRTAYNSVRDSGCENIYVGTWILKQNIVETGTIYGGIAYYHSATRGIGSSYANKVMKAMQKQTPAFSQ